MTSLERPLVVKYGGSSTTNGNGIDEKRIGLYTDQIANARSRFPNIAVVASGSVPVGRSIWSEMFGDKPFPNRQTLAMLGTAQAHVVWQKAFAKHRIPAGQLLATYHQIDDQSPDSILDATIKDNFENGVIPVANENDALNLEEMARYSYGGENDGLASRIAIRFGAAALILFTDTEGLMYRDDRSRIVNHVPFDEESIRFARIQAGWIEGESEGFENSMLCKVDACHSAVINGVPAYIARAGTSIIDILAEQAACTSFEASSLVA